MDNIDLVEPLKQTDYKIPKISFLNSNAFDEKTNGTKDKDIYKDKKPKESNIKDKKEEKSINITKKEVTDIKDKTNESQKNEKQEFV